MNAQAETYRTGPVAFLREQLEESGRALGLAVGLCLLSALVVYLVWGWMGLSGVPPRALGGYVAKPWGWRRFTVLVLPVLCLLPTVVLLFVQYLAPRDAGVWRKALRRDLRATWVVAPLWALAPWAWSRLEAPLVYLGAVFLLGLALKALALLGWLFAGFAWRWRELIAAVLVLWTLFGGMAVWADRTLSTYGDAVTYLLFAHSLAEHGKLDSRIAVQRGEYRRFYWGRWSKNFASKTGLIRASAYPYILAVPYALGGRLGVLLFFALLLAGSTVLTTGWLVRGAGAHPPHALGAALLVFSSAPVIFMSHVEFPDTVGIFLVSLGLWALGRARGHPWAALAALAAQAVLAVAAHYTKQRLMIGFTGLGLAAFFQWVRYQFSSRWLYVAVPAAVAGMVFWAACRVSPFYWETWQVSGPVWRTLGLTLAGLFWDQNYGLFAAAPIFFLGLAGAPVAWRRRSGAALAASCVILVPLGLLVYTNWYAWHGGFGTPFRYLVFTLPAWSLFLLPWLEASRDRLKQSIWLSFAIAGWLYLLICSVIPIIRPNRPVGMSRFWNLAEDVLGFPVHHLIPSAFMHTGHIVWWSLASLLLAALLGWWLWSAKEDRTETGGGWALSWGVASLVVLAAGSLLVGVAWLSPPTVWEAELMQGRTPVWAPVNFHYMRGRVLLDGDTLRQRVRIPASGRYRLRAVYIAQASGRLTLLLDGRHLADLPLEGTAHLKTCPLPPRLRKNGAFQRSFTGRRREAEVGVTLPGGWHDIELRYQGPSGRDEWFLLDCLTIE